MLMIWNLKVTCQVLLLKRRVIWVWVRVRGRNLRRMVLIILLLILLFLLLFLGVVWFWVLDWFLVWLSFIWSRERKWNRVHLNMKNLNGLILNRIWNRMLDFYLYIYYIIYYYTFYYKLLLYKLSLYYYFMFLYVRFILLNLKSLQMLTEIYFFYNKVFIYTMYVS